MEVILIIEEGDYKSPSKLEYQSSVGIMRRVEKEKIDFE